MLNTVTKMMFRFYNKDFLYIYGRIESGRPLWACCGRRSRAVKADLIA